MLGKSIKINPLTKVILYIILFVLIFLSRNTIQLIIITICIVSLIIISRESRKYILKSILYMGPMFILAFVLWSIFYNFSLFHRYSEGNYMFSIGFFMTLRLFLIVSTSLLFVTTVSPRDLITALRYFKLPYKIIFTLSLTLRHISTFSEEYMIIKEAQTSRGLELDKGFLIKRIRNYVPVLIPLLVRSIENAEKLSLAMNLKLFSFNKRVIAMENRFDKYNILILLSLISIFFISLYFIWM